MKARPLYKNHPMTKWTNSTMTNRPLTANSGLVVNVVDVVATTNTTDSYKNCIEQENSTPP